MSSFLTFLTFVLLITISLVISPIAASDHRPFKKAYVFGDSYTDTGNTNDSTGPTIFRHVSSPFYGRTFFHRTTNRYSDGRLFIDFIAESLNLPYFPPYLPSLNQSANIDTSHGVNFAVAGCAAIPFSFYKKNNVPLATVEPSLTTQLEWFKEFIKSSGCIDAEKTPAQCAGVFDGALVWIGEISANDYSLTFGTNLTSKTIQRLAIKYQTKVIRELLKMGAKYLVVQGLPTTGCLPLSFAIVPQPIQIDEIGCVAVKNKESYDHNTVLKEKLIDIRKKYPSSVIVYGDDWQAYYDVYKNAEKYGFVQRFRTCCGAGGGPYNFNVSSTCGAPGTSSCKHPSRYMNWDGVHVTEGLNRVISKLFLDGQYAQPSFPYLLKKATENKV